MNVADLLLSHGLVPQVPTRTRSMGTLKPLQAKASPLSPPSPPKRARGCEGPEPRLANQQRTHLLTLAEAHGLPADLVHRLHAADLAACESHTDATLLAYLRALEQSARMDAGMVPPAYTVAAECAGCGPVWLWPGVPASVIACPWCARRKAGLAIPRPPVTCGTCRCFTPDSTNPGAGIGCCTLAHGRSHWPMQPHRCADHRHQTTENQP